MWRSKTFGNVLVGALLLGAGCMGAVGDGTTGGGANGQPGGGSGGGPGSSSGSGGGPGTMTPGPTSSDTGAGTFDLRRLTMTEYNHTVRDLLGDNSAPLSVGVIGADQYGPSTFEVGGVIGDTDASALLEVSLKLANTAIGNLSQLMPGSPIPTDTAGQAMWAQQFITTFGKRAYRRPVLAAEAADLFALYQAQLDPSIGADFPHAIGAVITGMLMAPGFLYRWELGPQKPIVDGSLIRFNQYELASRLSYWLWATMPDDTLLGAADAGQLTTADQIQAQVRRMLADPKMGDGVTEFHMQWLLLTDLPTQNKDAMTFTPALVASMLGETRQFTSSVYGPQGDGKLATLLTSSNTFIDANLASLYGVPAPTGTGFSPVTLDSHQRAGILTQASYLAMRSNPDKQNPVNVGVSVIRRLMCNDIQKPTNVFIPPLNPQTPNETIRQWYSQHASSTFCNSCHSTIDAIGFAFLNYDALGTWMTMDSGQPVDASGSFTTPGGTTAYMYKNAIDLVSELAKAPEVSDCATAMWLRYLNRRIEASGDATSLQTAGSALGAHANDMREMLVALSTTNAFTARLPNPGENIQ